MDWVGSAGAVVGVGVGRVAHDARGRAHVVLAAPGEVWAPEPPDGSLELGDVVGLRPSEYPRSWDLLGRSYRRYEADRLGALAAAIERDGVLTPIEIDVAAGCVERGHHRVVAAQMVGLERVPYVDGRREERWCWNPATGMHVPYLYELDAFDEDADR
jgi:hypothetical protein